MKFDDPFANYDFTLGHLADENLRPGQDPGKTLYSDIRFFSKRVGEEPGIKGSRGQGFEGAGHSH